MLTRMQPISRTPLRSILVDFPRIMSTLSSTETHCPHEKVAITQLKGFGFKEAFSPLIRDHEGAPLADSDNRWAYFNLNRHVFLLQCSGIDHQPSINHVG